jgi:hypothetical protein
VVVESNLELGADNLFGRITWVEKTAEDLQIANGGAGARYQVASVSAGYVRQLVRWQGATLGLGVRGALNLVPAALEPSYGTRLPVGAAIYLRVRPASSE